MRNKDKSAAWNIFNLYYVIALAQRDTYTEGYAENYGIPTSGDKAIDKALGDAITQVRLTIPQIAAKLDAGIAITLCAPVDSVEIYQLIVEHLQDWQRKINDSFTEIEIPMDDLQTLDRLASLLHPIASDYMEVKPRSRGLFARLETLSGNRGSMAPVSTTVDVRPKDHISITDKMSKAVFSRRSKWS